MYNARGRRGGEFLEEQPPCFPSCVHRLVQVREQVGHENVRLLWSNLSDISTELRERIWPEVG